MSDVIARVRQQLEHAERRRMLAVSIDVADVQQLLAMVPLDVSVGVSPSQIVIDPLGYLFTLTVGG